MMTRRAKVLRRRRMRFAKRVRRVIVKTADKKYTSRNQYIVTTGVQGQFHLQNHRAMVKSFIWGDQATNTNPHFIVFPTQGDLNGQYDGRGYRIKGFLIRWAMDRQDADERLALRIRLMSSRTATTFGRSAGNYNVNLSEFWERFMTSYETYDETQGAIKDGYRVLKHWDIAVPAIYARATNNDISRSGKFWIPFKCLVKDASQLVTINGEGANTLQIPQAAERLNRWFWCITPHKTNEAVGSDTNAQLDLNTRITFNIEMHYADV